VRYIGEPSAWCRRPVLESERLPKLILSQVRYIGEPSAWCRMTPHVEKDEIIMVERMSRAAIAGMSAVLASCSIVVGLCARVGVAWATRTPLAARATALVGLV
jgi:hypothetical protein